MSLKLHCTWTLYWSMLHLFAVFLVHMITDQSIIDNYYPLIDIFLYSHYSSAWYCTDSVRRILLRSLVGLKQIKCNILLYCNDKNVLMLSNAIKKIWWESDVMKQWKYLLQVASCLNVHGKWFSLKVRIQKF